MAEQFRSLLEAGLIYRLSGSEVSQSSMTYKDSEHPYVLRFLPTTTISKLHEAPPQIQLEKFMLLKFDQLQSLANTNMELPDVVGQIRFVQGNFEGTKPVIRLFWPSRTKSRILRKMELLSFRLLTLHLEKDNHSGSPSTLTTWIGLSTPSESPTVASKTTPRHCIHNP